MTDTTNVKPGEKQLHCDKCDKTDHTTSGHIDGGSPTPLTTNGHIDGGAPPEN